MNLSDWQLALIREALRAYKCYGADIGGRDFTWASIAEGIAETAGVDVPPERLRQFVEGVNAKDGTRKHPVPSPERLDAIIRFVTDSDLALLSEAELHEYAPEHQAPLKLLDYLDHAQSTERLIPTGRMRGTYRVLLTDEDGVRVREITMQRPSERGLVQVIETEDIYGPDASEAFTEWTAQERLELRRSRIRHGGWAVVTPEDTLIFFLKNARNGRNRYYLTLASDFALWSDAAVTFLALLHHEFPLELEEQDTDAAEIARRITSDMARNLVIFRRIAGEKV
jgi:hypothetical protein